MPEEKPSRPTFRSPFRHPWAIPTIVLALLVSFTIALTTVYNIVKQQTIEALYARQAVHARQAVRGIRNSIDHAIDTLEMLARMPSIVDLTPEGRRTLTEYQRTHPQEITGVTRADRHARIAFTVPDARAIGSDISGQDHIRRIFTSHRTVISDVFMAVQGFRSVAIHVPVIRDGQFDGTLAFLLSFDHIAQHHIESIRVEQTGYAWVLSAKGYEISCPVPGHVGNHISRTGHGYPEVLAMAGQMLQGREGRATYHFDQPAPGGQHRVLKHAVYMPIPLGDTFWSIVVATPEEEALDSLRGFRARLVWITLALLLFGVAGTFLMVRAQTIVREQRKRQEITDALAESERKYRVLIETTGTGYVIVDEAGTVLDANPEYVRLSGHRELAEITGRNVQEWLAKGDRERNLERMRECFAGGGVRNLEIDYVDGRGGVTPVEINATTIEMGGRRLLLALCRDIGERKQAELERERLRAELAQAQRVESIGRLAGGVAHDFNNMLGVIIGRCEIALHGLPEGARVRSDIEEIHRAALRSETLTRQLLAFARKQAISPQVLDLNAAVADTLGLLRRLIGEDIELLWQPGRDLPLVKFDPIQLEHLLTNLAVNARDAIAGVGRIVIETAHEHREPGLAGEVPPGDYVLLRFSDNGCGMDAETRAHIFEPFFTTKASGHGTGLGLAMVYGIVTQSRGFIEAESVPGKGSTFLIRLPPCEETERVGAAPTRPGPPQAGHETLLLVEDEAMVLQITRSMLEMLGYRVLTAASPQEAITLVESGQGPIDLLVTDLIMPQMNGRQLAQKLTALRPGLHCLFISGYTADVITHHGVLAPGIHFLQKPFNSGELATKVRAALGS